ncbi:MAG: SDR family NAD(P)-dependent oxidoreductase [Bacteroidetes bacterium]|nr:SDR family NAD(P)-dependent oxidoreductase [Bacteroidota bacterium]
MKNKIVLIAGASGGIGSACARLFGKAGAKIVLAARNVSKAEEIAKEINGSGGDAYVSYVDVTDISSVTALVNDTAKELGKIDVLINAFGIGMIKPLLDMNPSDAKKVFDVNVYGTFLLTQSVMRYMETEKKGTVVMYPGTMGKFVMKGSSVYSAAKHALVGFTKGLVEENKRNSIRFSLIYAGGVNTPFWDNPTIEMKVQKEKMLTVEEVAKATYYAVSMPYSAVLNEIVLQPETHQLV